MSMDALSLACNLMTVIDFSHKFFRVYRQTYENGKVDADAQRNTDELSQLILALRKSQDQACQSLPKDDQLLRVANQCFKAAEELKHELTRFNPSPSPSRIGKHLQALKLTAKRNWRHGKIEELKRSMERCEGTMQSVILAKMYANGEAQDLKRQQGFGDLEKRLQNFIYAVSKREFQISQLFAENQVLHQETRAVVRQEIVALNAARISEEESSRFKSSLKFQGLNQRYNEVATGHEDSFQWLLSKVSPPDTTELKEEPYHLRNLRSRTFDDFSQWLHEETLSKLYWVSGKPGAGKSTFMKFLCQQMKDDASITQEPYIVLHYFFWLGPFNTRSRQNDMEGLFSTILHQILEIDASMNISLVARLWCEIPRIRRNESPTDWSLEDLKSTTQAALRILGRKYLIYILIDALDEHLPSAYHDKLVHAVRNLESMPKVRLVVSSRREPLFEKAFVRCRQLQLEHLTSFDIHHFAVGSLREDIESRFPSDSSAQLLMDLVEKIVKKADGVFLWARLAIDSVKRGLFDENGEDELRDRLDDMPRELSTYFKSIWTRLGDDEKRYQTKAANVFSLMLCDAWKYGVWPSGKTTKLGRSASNRAGTDLLSLSLALALEDARSFINEEKHLSTKTLLELCRRCRQMIFSHCAGLVEIFHPRGAPASDDCIDVGPNFPNPDGNCRFIHRTARDFFLDAPAGKAIVNSNDLGRETPNFRIMLASLARSVAFREQGHDIRTCKLMQNLDLAEWLRMAHPLGAVGSNLTLEQRYCLISLCHKVHYRFCGSLENPRFAGWVIIHSSHQVRPFMIDTAFYGHLDYATNSIQEQVRGGALLSPALYDAVLKASFMSLIAEAKFTSSGPISEASKKFLMHYVFILPSFLSQFNTIVDLGTRLPRCCLPPLFRFPGESKIAPSSISRHFHSTSQLIIALILILSEAYGGLNASHAAEKKDLVDFVPEALVKLLGILNEYSTCLQEEMTGIYCVKAEHSSSEKNKFQPTLQIPQIGVESEDLFGSRGVRMMLAFSPLWALQWIARSTAAYVGPNEVSRCLRDFVESAVRKGRHIQEARPIFLISLSFGDWDKYIGIKEIKTLPVSLSHYLWEPQELTSTNPEEWGHQHEDLCERFEEACNHPMSETLSGVKLEEALVSHGIWCSIEERERATEACNIRMPSQSSLPIDRQNKRANPDRIMIPPEGTSNDDDDDLSYYVMAIDK